MQELERSDASGWVTTIRYAQKVRPAFLRAFSLVLRSSISDDFLFLCGDFGLRPALSLRGRERFQLLGGLFSKGCQFESDRFLLVEQFLDALSSFHSSFS